ncbi:MAG: TspO/MBR family protein [Verrucomicrobiota bacterium]
MHPPKSIPRQVAVLIGFILITFCAPALGVFGPPGEWYAGLEKPSWNPPPWIFGPVWTALYLMIAVAAWLVWRKDGWKRPMALYFIQLALNAAWTPIFFGAHQLGWALFEIMLLWVAILLTALAFCPVHRVAALLLVPYLCWVSFATFLNFTLWRLNS